MVEIVRQNYSYNKKKAKKIILELKKHISEEVTITHVGSTSIPKMSGKNIIDLLIGVKNSEDFNDVAKKLINIGYFPSEHSKTNEYQFFASRVTETQNGDVHIHLVKLYTDRYNNFILLKNYLLKHPEVAKEYVKYKRQILKYNGTDREDYKKIKSEYVSKLIQNARRDEKESSLSSIILVRHGENVYNDKLQNDLLPLSKLGKKQAMWAKEILNESFDIIISSPSKRAKQTASIIGNGLDFIQDYRLIERGWGNKLQDGKETDSEAKLRFKDFFDDISKKFAGKKVLMVFHGSLIKIAQDVIEGIVVQRNSVDNCSIIQYSKLRGKDMLKLLASPFDQYLK